MILQEPSPLHSLVFVSGTNLRHFIQHWHYFRDFHLVLSFRIALTPQSRTYVKVLAYMLIYYKYRLRD